MMHLATIQHPPVWVTQYILPVVPVCSHGEVCDECGSASDRRVTTGTGSGDGRRRHTQSARVSVSHCHRDGGTVVTPAVPQRPTTTPESEGEQKLRCFLNCICFDSIHQRPGAHRASAEGSATAVWQCRQWQSNACGSTALPWHPAVGAASAPHGQRYYVYVQHSAWHCDHTTTAG